MPEILLLAALFLASATAEAQAPAAASAAAAVPAPVQVVATTPELRSLVEVVGGNRVAVKVPEAKERRAALRASALLVRAGLGLEPWVDPAKLPRRLKVVDASEGVRLVHGNRYYWLDPHNAQPITASILGALAKLDPADEERFQANRDAFLSLLNEKLFQWEKKLAPLRGEKVVADHDDWASFAERFGLRLVPASAAGVRLIIADPRSHPARLRSLEEKTGAPAVVLLTSGGDYLGLFDENVRRLAGK
jgi:ABC-type Zn uptake system ZnuABC Zn-binding protein ZnuA